MRRLVLPLGAAAVIAALILPAAASATDYCVVPGSGCTIPNTFPATAAGVQAALDAAGAAADADRVLLGTGRYVAATANGFSYAHPTFPLELIGKGTGQTTLGNALLSNQTLAFDSTAGSVVRDLTVEVPRKASGGFPIALHLTRATARNVAVVPDPTQANTYGANAVELTGGTFVGGSVTLPMAGSFAAIGTLGPNNIVRDSTLTASLGLNVNADNMTASGLRITGGEKQAVSVLAVGITLADSTIVQQGQGPAVYVSTGNNVDAAITLDHDTIVGDDTADSDGVYADGFDLNTNSATITLRNSIIRGFTHSLGRAAQGGGGTANVTTSYSDYPPTTETDGGGGPGGYNQGIGNIDADPGFVNASGDYRLPAGSPAIDAGDPAGLLGNEPSVDLVGLPRVAAGNAGCVLRSDMGALEFQTDALCGPAPPTADTTAPVLSHLGASRLRFKPARANKPVGTRGTVLRFTLSEAATVKLAIVRRATGHRSGGKCRKQGRGPRCTTAKTLITLTAHGQAGVNHYAFRGRVRSHALAPGSYEVVATAVDAAGNRTANAVKLRFRVIR